MSATTVQLTAANHRAQQSSSSGWPACELSRVAGDGSLRWLGAVALTGSGLLTLGTIGWLGKALLRLL